MKKDNFKAVIDELNKIRKEEQDSFIFINDYANILCCSGMDAMKFIAELMTALEEKGNMPIEQQKLLIDAMINLGKMQKESK